MNEQLNALLDDAISSVTDPIDYDYLCQMRYQVFVGSEEFVELLNYAISCVSDPFDYNRLQQIKQELGVV